MRHMLTILIHQWKYLNQLTLPITRCLPIVAFFITMYMSNSNVSTKTHLLFKVINVVCLKANIAYGVV